ncbi:MAG: hypothetical protein ACU0CO_15760 [Shimia sp.]
MTGSPEPNDRARWSRLDKLAAACILGAACPVVFATDPNVGLAVWLGAALLLTVLISLPFVLLALFARILRIRALRAVAGAVPVLLLGLWWWALCDTFMVPEHSDPLNGLILVFLPIFAAVAVVVIGMVLWILEMVLGRRG